MDWLSIQKKLPPIFTLVLVTDEYSDFVCMGMVTDDYINADEASFLVISFFDLPSDWVVTHWQKLPPSLVQKAKDL